MAFIISLAILIVFATLSHGLNPTATWNTTKYDIEKGLNSPACPSDDGDGTWFNFNGNCYYLNLCCVNWYEAEKICLDRGAHLTSIQSVMENEVLVGYFLTMFPKKDQSNCENPYNTDIDGSYAYSFWNGFVRFGNTGRPSDFGWINGDANVYTNWSPGGPPPQWHVPQPDNGHGFQACGSVRIDTPYWVVGSWDDDQCWFTTLHNAFHSTMCKKMKQ